MVEFEGVGRAFRFLGCHKFGGEDFRHDLSEYLQKENRLCLCGRVRQPVLLRAQPNRSPEVQFCAGDGPCNEGSWTWYRNTTYLSRKLKNKKVEKKRVKFCGYTV